MRYLILIAFCFFSTSVFCQIIPLPDSLRQLALNEKVIIQRIELSGNKKTKDKIILRELSVTEGQLVRSDSLAALAEQNRLRLMTVSLFTEIRVHFDTVNSSEVLMNICVQERWYIIPEVDFRLADRNFNVWWTEQKRDIRRSVIGLKLTHKNFRGNLENISVATQVGYRQEFSFAYSKPYVDKKQRHGFGVLLGVSQANEVYYATDSNKLLFAKKSDDYIMRYLQGSLSYSFRPNYASSHIFRVTYKEQQIDDTVLQLNPEYFLNESNKLNLIEFSYRYNLNKVDNWNYPLRGHKLIAHVFFLEGIKGMDQLLFGTLQTGSYYHLTGKWYLSMITRSRLLFFTSQPYVMRSALGTQYEYVRGYEYYVVDGSHYALGRFNFKRELLNINIRNIPFKYLPVIPLRIYPKVFADAGYVHDPYKGNGFLNNRVLYSAGLGVDIFTAYDFKIRAEYAWNHLGQKGLFLHFVSE